MAGKCNYLFKVLLIGPQGSGKSGLLTRCTENKFDPNQKSTIGVDFGAHLFEIGHYKIKLQLWDITGNSDYATITKSYYSGAQIILIAVDLSKKPEENKIYLQHLMNDPTVSDPQVVKFLVGTKADLPQAQANKAENLKMTHAFATEHKDANFHDYSEATSAKEGTNVDGAFKTPAQIFFDQEQARVQKQKQAESEIADNTIKREHIYQFVCFKDLNAALTLIQNDINNYQKMGEAPVQVTALQNSLVNLRDKLTTIYLQRVPSKIAKAIEEGKPLTKEQKQQLDKITKTNTQDIATIGTEAKSVVEHISNCLKNPEFKPQASNTLPPEIQQAATNIGKIMRNPMILKACAAFLIIALCVIGGVVGGFFLGVIGSIPGATIGTLLGIEITTTLLGTATVATALGAAGIYKFGLFPPGFNNYQTIKQCGQEIQKTAQDVLVNANPVPQMQV